MPPTCLSWLLNFSLCYFCVSGLEIASCPQGLCFSRDITAHFTTTFLLLKVCADIVQRDPVSDICVLSAHEFFLFIDGFFGCSCDFPNPNLVSSLDFLVLICVRYDLCL